MHIFNDVKHPQRKWPANTAVSFLWRGKRRDAGLCTDYKESGPAWMDITTSFPDLSCSHALVFSFQFSPICNHTVTHSGQRPLLFSRICVSSLIGSSSNGNGDGNENGKKEIGFFSKRTLYTCITLFCTFLFRTCTTTT